MAKGQVSDQDLEAGIKTLGGLGNLAAAAGARRDSPFGSDFVKKTAPVHPAAAAPRQAVVAEVKEVVRPMPASEPAAVKTVELKKPAENAPPPRKVSLPPKPKAEASPIEVDSADDKKVIRKADICTERLTIQMSPDMRDELALLANKLQRKKTDKSERITSNTLMRVAIQFMLDEADLCSGEVANSEEELLRVLKSKFRKR